MTAFFDNLLISGLLDCNKVTIAIPLVINYLKTKSENIKRMKTITADFYLVIFNSFGL